MKKPETPSVMAVSIAAFICNIILVSVFCLRYGNPANTNITKIEIMIFVVLALIFIITPVVMKINAYNIYFNPPQGFSASYAVRQYKLSGWIKGKYLFLDAIFNRVNGDFSTAVQKYEKCLKVAKDKRLRLACYTDMARYMSTSINLIPYFIEASREFPEEISFINAVSRYFVWCPTADPQEGEKWFREVIENNPDSAAASAAYTFLGCRTMYSGDYENALENFLKAKEMNNAPPAYLILDIAVCYACLGDYDKAREYGVLAAAIVDDKEEIDYIREKLDYIFKAKTNEVNPETEKLVTELARRDSGRETETLDKYRGIEAMEETT